MAFNRNTTTRKLSLKELPSHLCSMLINEAEPSIYDVYDKPSERKCFEYAEIISEIYDKLFNRPVNLGEYRRIRWGICAHNAHTFTVIIEELTSNYEDNRVKRATYHLITKEKCKIFEFFSETP